MNRDSKFYIKIGMLVNLGALILTSHGIIFGYVVELNPIQAFLMNGFGLYASWISFIVFWSLVYRYHNKIGEYLSEKFDSYKPAGWYNSLFAIFMVIGAIPDLINDLYVFSIYLSIIGLI